MITFIFLIISLIPFGITALILQLSHDHNKSEAVKPFIIGLIILCLGIYLDYKIILDNYHSFPHNDLIETNYL